ncbi:FecR domain-containing protein [Pseudomonas sp. UL073]|uniref:FecR domain-containing protein n=1 Tax=Zestomonas insulae TaxID=2809017 RepID=A0ABS2IAB0_9GAMM|nr:FecR domain-containing protein [Pseudomonas insulae]MBM7060064.1 FecR domain-containing protein [Pseudomonas insulae]
MHAPISAAVAEQAVRWLLELQDGQPSDQQRQAWAAWRAAAPEHEQAWQRIESVNQRLRGVPSGLARRTLDAPASRQRRDALKTLAVLLGAGATSWGLLEEKPWQPWLADQHTAVGERRDLTLADGTRLVLNTDSAVNIRFDHAQRLIDLQRGEIFLHGAADPRPLRVSTPHGLIDPAGTQLSVRLADASSRVSLFEGQALVQPRAHAGAPLRLLAGQQLSFDSRQLGALQTVDENSRAWSRGMLIASQMRLADFLAELSRYRHGRLSCDPAIADLRLSGSYPLDDSERILALLPRALPIEVRHFTRYWVSVHPRARA